MGWPSNNTLRRCEKESYHQAKRTTAEQKKYAHMKHGCYTFFSSIFSLFVYGASRNSHHMKINIPSFFQHWSPHSFGWTFSPVEHCEFIVFSMHALSPHFLPPTFICASKFQFQVFFFMRFLTKLHLILFIIVIFGIALLLHDKWCVPLLPRSNWMETKKME